MGGNKKSQREPTVIIMQLLLLLFYKEKYFSRLLPGPGAFFQLPFKAQLGLFINLFRKGNMQKFYLFIYLENGFTEGCLDQRPEFCHMLSQQVGVLPTEPPIPLLKKITNELRKQRRAKHFSQPVKNVQNCIIAQNNVSCEKVFKNSGVNGLLGDFTGRCHCRKSLRSRLLHM